MCTGYVPATCSERASRRRGGQVSWQSDRSFGIRMTGILRDRANHTRKRKRATITAFPISEGHRFCFCFSCRRSYIRADHSSPPPLPCTPPTVFVAYPLPIITSPRLANFYQNCSIHCTTSALLLLICRHWGALQTTTHQN